MVLKFTHADAGAPQIDSTPGAVNTILEWVLTKLGWTIVFRDDTNKIMCFRSGEPSSTNVIYRVDDSNSNYAEIVGYEEMTDVNTGTNSFGKSYIVKKYSNNEWTTIADEKGIYLLTLNLYARVKFHELVYFGDAVSIATSDSSCAIIISKKTNTANGIYVTGLKQSMFSNKQRTKFDYSFNLNSASSSRQVEISDSLSGRREFYEVFIKEQNQNRGIVPGMLMTPTKCSELAVKLDNIDNMDGEEVLLVDLTGRKNPIAINLTTWGR